MRTRINRTMRNRGHKRGGWKSMLFRKEQKNDFEKAVQELTENLILQLKPSQELLHRTFYETDFKNTVFVHFMRPPLDTVISGFHYHLKAEEGWLEWGGIRDRHYGKERVQNIHLYTDLMNNRLNKTDFYRKYWETSSAVMDCFDRKVDGIGIDMDSLNLTMNASMNYKDFLNSVDAKEGILWELIRYFECEWPSQYLMHQIGMEHFDGYLAFNLDDFGNPDGFDQQINLMLDAWNIVDDEHNNQRLHSLNVSNVSINQQRAKLFQMMKRLDLNARGNATKNRHVTKGKFDKDKDIQNLLGRNEAVCVLTKRMTVFMGFIWKYTRFC